MSNDLAGDRSPTLISVPVANSYSVHIGSELWNELQQLVPNSVRRVMIVHAPTVLAIAVKVKRQLKEAGIEVLLEELPDAEAAKTIDVAARCWERLGRADFNRSDLVMAVGGGASTDLGGYVAAGWLRGVPVVQIPTTLLAMVDAAVGGKVGVNTAEGKNLVGAFHDPLAVLCDLSTLESLPRHELIAGMGEVVKCGFIADPEILAIIEANPEAAVNPRSPVLRELIERSVKVKAEVVAADPRESDLREILNYGHTFGHAIERAEAFLWRHGAAVSVGMMFAGELARLAGILPSAVVERQRSVLTTLGLPTSYRSDRWPDLLASMRRDKKTRGATLRFVVLEGIGKPTRLEGPSPELLAEAYSALCAAGKTSGKGVNP